MQSGSVADGGWRITSESSAPDGRPPETKHSWRKSPSHQRPGSECNRLFYNRLIYKGECQEKYFSLDRKWKGSSPETLKRLAILVSQRRSFLPSSTESA